MSTIQDIFDKITDTAKDLTVLEIKTLMGEMEILNNGKVQFKTNQDIQGISSRIDLIDGDITTHITEEFYNKYPELVQWHQSREAKGNEIIEGNIQTLTSIVSHMRKMLPKETNV
jgi:uncharacterized protein with HEPN domain